MHDPYRELIRSLPIPTEQQTTNFAKYVVGAHSWYKHLPCTPPGAPFAFFLDPNAGREPVSTEGYLSYHDRVNEREAFHYTWMPTTVYRERFGHWEYATDRGTTLIATFSDGRSSRVGPHAARVATANGAVIPVSPSVLAVGTLSLTAHVHEHFVAGKVGMMARMYGWSLEGNDDSAWAREKRPILELWERHKHDFKALDRLLDEERTRQRAELHDTLLGLRTFLEHWLAEHG